MNNSNYIAIADWMISDYNFSTRELLCFAIIYGFSQDGESVFSGSLNYLSQWLGIRRDNVLRYLNGLVEKGAVVKEKKTSAAKSWCEYKAVVNKGIVRETDHIIISPWMIEDLGLQDKELILYSLIYGFSRFGSNSFFTGNNSYMAKWLNIDKSNVKRYTSSLIKKGLIRRTEESLLIKYEALKPCSNGEGGHFEYTQVNNDGYGQIENTPSQNEYTQGHTEELGIVNLSTNNIFLKNLNNNLIDIVVDKNQNNYFDLSLFVSKASFQISRVLEAHNFSEEGIKDIKKTLSFISNVVNCYGLEKIDIINSFSDKECRLIYEEATSLTDDLLDSSIENKNAKLSSTIGKFIKKHKK